MMNKVSVYNIDSPIAYAGDLTQFKSMTGYIRGIDKVTDNRVWYLVVFSDGSVRWVDHQDVIVIGEHHYG